MFIEKLNLKMFINSSYKESNYFENVIKYIENDKINILWETWESIVVHC